jgi:hypothetical protein
MISTIIVHCDSVAAVNSGLSRVPQIMRCLFLMRGYHHMALRGSTPCISRNNLGLLFRELSRAANARCPMRPEQWTLLIRSNICYMGQTFQQMCVWSGVGLIQLNFLIQLLQALLLPAASSGAEMWRGHCSRHQTLLYVNQSKAGVFRLPICCISDTRVRTHKSS